MSPMNYVGKNLLPPIFIPNSVHNQSASRIIALTFLTKNVSKESAFLVQMGHPYRAFLRNQIRTNSEFLRLSQYLQVREFLRLSHCLEFRQGVLTVHTALTLPRVSTALTVPRVPSALTLPRVASVLTVPELLRLSRCLKFLRLSHCLEFPQFSQCPELLRFSRCQSCFGSHGA